MSRLYVIPCLLLASILFSCSHGTIRNVQQAMRKAGAPSLSDDLPLEPLTAAVEKQAALLKNQPNVEMTFGPRKISKERYAQALIRFAELAKTSPSRESFLEAVAREFEFYEVYGVKKWGDVFITSYYEPIIPGSLKRTDRFSQPLYKAPDDLLTLDLTVFDDKYSADRKLRGRVDGKKILPYYSREQIDSGAALNGKKLELCYVDPIDAFMLQIQGSGTVDLGNGKVLRLGYAEKNGQSYQAVGRFLRDVIPSEKMNLASIELHLRSLPEDRLQRLLNKNPSYVFFREATDSAMTSIGLSATDGRTIATDPRFFPKGAVGFLVARKPTFDGLLPIGWEPLSRFVLDQDVGGAITGPGRMDLFWGRGEDAKMHAGMMKEHGTLYYLLPKETAK